MRLELGRPREVRAREIALELPLAQAEQELLPGPLVDRLTRRAGVELRVERRQLRDRPSRRRAPRGTGVTSESKYSGTELGEPAHE